MAKLNADDLNLEQQEGYDTTPGTQPKKSPPSEAGVGQTGAQATEAVEQRSGWEGEGTHEPSRSPASEAGVGQTGAQVEESVEQRSGWEGEGRLEPKESPASEAGVGKTGAQVPEGVEQRSGWEGEGPLEPKESPASEAGVGQTGAQVTEGVEQRSGWEGEGPHDEVEARYDQVGDRAATDPAQESKFEEPREESNSSYIDNQSSPSEAAIGEREAQGTEGLQGEPGYDQAPSSEVDTGFNPPRSHDAGDGEKEVVGDYGSRASEGTPAAAGESQPPYARQRSYGSVPCNAHPSEAGFGSHCQGGYRGGHAEDWDSPAPVNEGRTEVADRGQQSETTTQQGGFPVPTRPPGAVLLNESELPGPKYGESEPGNDQPIGGGQQSKEYGESEQVGEGGLPTETTEYKDPNNQQIDESGLPTHTTEYKDPNNQQIDESGLPSQTRDDQSQEHLGQTTGYPGIPSQKSTDGTKFSPDSQVRDAEEPTEVAQDPAAWPGEDDAAASGYGAGSEVRDGVKHGILSGDVPSGVGQSNEVEDVEQQHTADTVPHTADTVPQDLSSDNPPYTQEPTAFNPDEGHQTREADPISSETTVAGDTQEPTAFNPDEGHQTREADPISSETTVAGEKTEGKEGIISKLKHMWPGQKHHEEVGIHSPPATNPEGEGKSPGLKAKLKEKLTPRHKDENVAASE